MDKYKLYTPKWDRLFDDVHQTRVRISKIPSKD
jgi:hypothetical protein